MEKKKRGRKPKPKPDVDNTLPKKKRGRKKKCEMNLDIYKKITGYCEGNSIDTKDNQIQFTMDDKEYSNCENVNFGGIFNIQKISNTEEIEVENLKKIYHEKTNNNKTKCEIILDEIVLDEKTQENTENKENKNLLDFFGTPEVSINTTKKKKKDIYNKNFINTNKTEYEKIKILHCYRGKEKELPNKTNIWCWWCCHPFDTIPRFIPTKYDNIRKRYKITGNFCGWSCAKAFMYYDTNYTIKNNMSMFTNMIKEIHGSFYDVKCAPPKAVLKNFGGTIDIEEFRAMDKNIYFEINNHIMNIDESYHIRKITH